MRIGTRILLGFGMVVALTVGMGLYALKQQANVRKFSSEIDTRDARILDTLRQIAGAEGRMRALRGHAMVYHLLARQRTPVGDPKTLQQEWMQSRNQNLRLLSELDASAAAYERDAVSPLRKAQWRRIQTAARESQDALRALTGEAEMQFELATRTDLSEMTRRLPVIEKLRETFESKIMEAQRLTEEQVALGRSEIDGYFDETRNSVAAAVVLAALLGILLTILIQRSITGPLDVFMRFVEQVGHGDLTKEAPASRADELGDLARSLNQMVVGLKDVASQARRMAEDLGAATAEILASTQQQAASTAEQAAAVQQANATMSQITQAGSQISDRARQVAASAEATSGASSAGLQSVQNTALTMERIREQAEAVADNVIALSEKTQAIGEIISTVNDIAEQSHLLALNAAIEAAAAGEHGRSFSVVASEMKNLADQSKQATVQVRSILGDIQKAINSSVMLTEEAVKRVESGRQQAGSADRAIRALTDNIEESVRAFQQIVAGSSQQQIGFEQVTQAFRSIGVATQQTATSTRQSEKAAANLNSLAQQLRAVVERYRI
ncbi:MAG TPA: methyl-accepting chemotaxis protein [Bryobacteraceae bacterium]|nr:methyl-accepting chemotaxis protein [Bryobacteraceae bacterium]